MVAGGCACLPGGCMVAGGHAWLPGGGMCGCRGVCMVAGDAWLPGGMCGCWGVCVVARGHA